VTSRRRVVGGLLGAVLVTACGSVPTPASSPLASAGPSDVAAVSGSIAPSPATASPPSTPAPTATPAPTPKPTPVPWQVFTSKQYRYRIGVPPYFPVKPGGANEDDIFNRDYPWVFVHASVRSEALSLGDEVDSIVSWERSHQRATLKSNRAIKLAGWPGRILTFDAFEGDRPIVIQYVELVRGKVEYALILYSSKALAADGKAIFKKMYLTWDSTR
jgi:hypothetical protein